MNQFDGLLWLLLMLVPLLFLQRALHREVQAVFLILTRRPAVTMAIFSLIFFPGVLLHEFSHFLIAKLVGVRTGGFSLIPRTMPDGRLRLGYVEVSQTDFVRDSLIGAAPLIFGGLFVSYAAIYQLDLLPLWGFFGQTQFSEFWTGLFALPNAPDFVLWFYLTFAVSSTMLPSPSDRHAWLPLFGIVVVLVGLAIVAGAGEWMLANLASPFNIFLRSVATLFGLSAAVHGLLVLPLALLHKLLARLTGVDIAA